MWKRGTGLPWPSAGVAAALGPADDRELRWPMACSQARFSPAAKSTCALRPLPRQVVLWPVEAGAAQPVLPGELAGVPDPQPPLLGRVDEEQSPERPPRLPAERLLGFLVQEQHAAARVGQLRCRGQAGQACPDHDDVGVMSHRYCGGQGRRPAGGSQRRARCDHGAGRQPPGAGPEVFQHGGIIRVRPRPDLRDRGPGAGQSQRTCIFSRHVASTPSSPRTSRPPRRPPGSTASGTGAALSAADDLASSKPSMHSR